MFTAFLTNYFVNGITIVGAAKLLAGGIASFIVNGI